MHTSDEYEQRRWSNTEKRKSAVNAKAWKKQLKKQKMLPLRRGPYACLVIGYNEVSEEIAVSNSWEPNEKFSTWISLRDAKRVSQQTSFVYQLPQNERSVSRNAGKKASKQKIKIKLQQYTEYSVSGRKSGAVPFISLLTGQESV